MKNILLAASIYLISISGAFALDAGGLFVEPMATYERGEGHVNFPSPINNSDTKVRDFGLGLRLGFHILETIFVAADGRYSFPKFKDTSLNQDVRAKSYNFGPTVGAQMPFLVGLRVWAGYIFGGVIDPDADKGVDEEFRSGNGYRVGAGLKIAMVSLNIEYQNIKYDEFKATQVGIFNTGFSSRDIILRNQAMVLSVSFPVAI